MTGERIPPSIGLERAIGYLNWGGSSPGRFEEPARPPESKRAVTVYYWGELKPAYRCREADLNG